MRSSGVWSLAELGDVEHSAKGLACAQLYENDLVVLPFPARNPLSIDANDAGARHGASVSCRWGVALLCIGAHAGECRGGGGTVGNEIGGASELKLISSARSQLRPQPDRSRHHRPRIIDVHHLELPETAVVGDAVALLNGSFDGRVVHGRSLDLEANGGDV
jgi:hypothetical protein